MHLTFLGTAASEGYPNAFCDCVNCRRARELGGPSLRKRSAALIDDALLIDLGPDLMAAAQQHGLSLAKVRYCLQTHEHDDHLNPWHLFSRSAYCAVFDTPRLQLYASQGALAFMAATLGSFVPAGDLSDPQVGAQFNLEVHTVVPGQSFRAGPYVVTVLDAVHDPQLEPLLYVVERAGRSLLYGTDTGPLSAPAMQLLANRGRPLNVVVLDHTFGLKERASGHMNQQQFLEQVAALRDRGLLAEDARIFAHHLGHHSNPPHPELAALAARYGYDVAYDGLTVQV